MYQASDLPDWGRALWLQVECWGRARQTDEFAGARAPGVRGLASRQADVGGRATRGGRRRAGGARQVMAGGLAGGLVGENAKFKRRGKALRAVRRRGVRVCSKYLATVH